MEPRRDGPPSAFDPVLALRVVTPRLCLQWPDAADQEELLAVAERGVHDPHFMPFLNPWTDVPTATRNEESRARWNRLRDGWTAEDWTWCGAVRVDGQLVGVQDLEATSFAATRRVASGSWLGREFQGRGLGAEMRAAILHLAFAGLGATIAVSGYLDGNEPSRRVSARLGYVASGDREVTVRGATRRSYEVTLTRDEWARRRRDDIRIEGLAACRTLFGLP